MIRSLVGIGLITLTLGSNGALASPITCRNLLSRAHPSTEEDFPRDSNTFRVYLDAPEALTAEAHYTNAQSAARLAISSAGCLNSDISFIENWEEYNGCREVVPNNPATMVCVVASNLGYFFVMQDLLEWTNVTWNRWD